ncbi:N-acyl homoserine lactonase family protein [Brevibacillus dissolubilis]|uniref:N-acyl homoserine lactonase family protein n=1 Tax=Brevibacillus dissolubilis TaxID=1844116 RepID=UPI0011179A30|nr:N-acyl homoserine lactonase family protein [Brevibacillus dissolubilis]
MPTVKLHILHTGSCTIDRSIAFDECTLNPLAITGLFRSEDDKLHVPISTYLLEHPQGLILVDAGLHTDIRVDAQAHLGMLNNLVMKAKLPPGQAIHEQLEEMGIRPRDLDYVVLTHFHTDHVSGLKHVAEAKRIITSEQEWEAANCLNPSYVPEMWEGVEVETFASKEIPFGPYREGIDLLGDGSIYVMNAPGHTEGHTSLLVKTESGWVYLASDAGYANASFVERIMPGIRTSDSAARRSLEYASDFIKRDDCCLLIANHDPAITPMVI